MEDLRFRVPPPEVFLSGVPISSLGWPLGASAGNSLAPVPVERQKECIAGRHRSQLTTVCFSARLQRAPVASGSDRLPPLDILHPRLSSAVRLEHPSPLRPSCFAPSEGHRRCAPRPQFQLAWAMQIPLTSPR